ncbi:hypothetical protein MMC18_003711 [Xylographa bjoerkii]|nr:hypothetical protein [Xylographa bjoerkii]
MSSAESLQSAQRAAKAPRPFDEDDEYGNAARNFQPRAPRAAQGRSVMKAGIRTIPLVLSLVAMGIAGAVFIESVGYYVPAILLYPCLCAFGDGMLSTLTPSTSSSHWTGHQVIYSWATGCGFQTLILAPQNVLPRSDVPLGMALMFLMQQLGGSVFLRVGPNIFSR